MGRPHQAVLNRTAIARAALDFIDDHGYEALTMRALADRLGVRGASLYHHVRSKDDILDAVGELLDAEIDVSPLRDRPWQEGITAYARGYRRVFLRHPNAISLVARRGVRGTDALREYDTLLGTLVRAGCEPAQALEVGAAIDFLVLGSALETYTAGFTRPPGEYRPAYPALADSLEAATRVDPDPAALDDRGFERGLALLLTGLSHELPPR
ncbi:TetR/AcrR family transcriptional regulator C-terminal domain-containing protein [Streptomyces sp. NPDC028635]|uniref:TetR/AcrR family transcriptional regulator C-terminal domain-containing protein n=1 Tax=Streptomyces sp. NPDC028635 TaxID=3154800 RepID=UPI0034067023